MPTRYLKPGICDSPRIEAVRNASAETLYYRLIVTVDDFGRFDARPLVIKGRCYPLKKAATVQKIEAWLAELHHAELIVLYVVSGAPYLQITKWGNKPRAESSLFPPVPTNADGCIQLSANAPGTGTGTGTGTVIASSDPASLSAGGLNGNAVAYLPLINGTEWGITPELLKELERAYPAVDGPTTLREMRAWCLCNPRQCKTAAGVKRFINTWFAKEQNRG